MVAIDLERNTETSDKEMATTVISRAPELIDAYMKKREEEAHTSGNVDFSMSLRKISLEMGIPYATAHRWYNGHIVNFTGDILGAWCEYLDCDVSDLLVKVDKDE